VSAISILQTQAAGFGTARIALLVADLVRRFAELQSGIRFGHGRSARRARFVGMPSRELFERQDNAYRENVLPDAISARAAVEQAGAIGWERYVGRRGAVVEMHTFDGSTRVTWPDILRELPAAGKASPRADARDSYDCGVAGLTRSAF